MKINFLYFELPEEEEQIRQLIEQVKFLAPSWIMDLSISRYISDEDNNAAAAVTNNHTYREAEILIYDKFFHTSVESRRRNLIHEFLHIRHSVVADWTRGSLLALVQEKAPDAHPYMDKEYTQRIEGYTQDMAYVIDELLGVPPKESTGKSSFLGLGAHL